MENKDEDFAGFTRREFFSLSACGAAGMFLGGFPDPGHAEEKKPKYGGRLRRASRFTAVGLDPHVNQDSADYFTYNVMYDALTEQGPMPQLEIFPMLCKSWEISNDGREYIFPLRQGVKFHHGKELDTGDVKYSIERVMNPATRSPKAFAYRWIDSIHIIDKYHLKIRLKEPFAPFLASLTCQNCGIVPSGSEPTPTKPAPGTGPFLLKSFVPNETFEAARFDKYWLTDEMTGDRLPYLEGIYLKKVVDDTVRWTALRAGDIDFCEAPPTKVIADAILKQPIQGMVLGYTNLGNSLLFFNLKKPPFDNKKVRQAIAHAIDKKAILKAVHWGLGETIDSQPFPRGSRFYIPVEDREWNLATARQLLTEAGYPNGFRIEFLQRAVSYDLAGCEAVIGQLKAVGIEATMKVLDRAAYFNLMRKGDYQISYYIISERFDWDDGYYMFFHSSETGKNNWSGYKNPKMDDLLEKGRTAWKTAERKIIYKEVLDLLRDDLPVYYICKSVTGYAFRDYVQGFRKGFASRLSFHGGGGKYLWLDK